MMSRPHLAGRAPVNWPRLLFRYAGSKTREQLALLQSKFSEVTTLYGSVPKTIEPIDWASWKKSIRTPGIVDQFQSEYEAEMKKEVKLNTAEIAAKNAQQEQEIRALEAKAQTSAEFLSELTAEIGWTQKWYNNPEEVVKGTMLSWNRFKREHYYPNYKIHRMNRLLFLGDPLQSEGREADRIDGIDLVQLRKQLENGNVRAMAAVVPIFSAVGDMSSLQRLFIKKWMKPVDYEEAFKNPNTSLAYRAFALKQIERGN